MPTMAGTTVSVAHLGHAHFGLVNFLGTPLQSFRAYGFDVRATKNVNVI